MRKFFYKAKKEDISINGVIEAKGEEEAAKLLHEQNLFIISITEEKKAGGINFASYFKNRLTLSDLAQMTRQLSSMITAGLTLTEAIAVLQNQTEKEIMSKTLGDIQSDVEGGSSFSTALSRHPKVFKPVYIAMIKAAEEAGLLDKVLARLADNLEKEKAFKGKIVGALIYPGIVIGGIIAVASIMMFFVLPTIKALYRDLGVKLPLPTQVVLSVSDFIGGSWFLVLGLLVILIFGFVSYRRTDLGERQLDSLSLRLPIFGKLRREIILTEMARTLGLLIGAGTPIIAALNITVQTLGSIWYKDSLNVITKKVEKGVSLGEALSQDSRFPAILTQMSRVGETTGKLDETLLKVSSYFETETEGTIKTLTTALEPLIMVVLGIGVALLIIAVIVPIYNLTTAF